jgi:hypothetical protein
MAKNASRAARRPGFGFLVGWLRHMAHSISDCARDCLTYLLHRRGSRHCGESRTTARPRIDPIDAASGIIDYLDRATATIVAPMKRSIDRQNHQPQRPGKRCVLLGFLAVFVLFTPGCKPKTETAADTKPAVTAAAVNPVGSYSLVSVDGKPVPCQVTHDGHTMLIKSGGFLINADGTCRSQMFLEGRDAAIEVDATYTQAGPQLTMKWQGAGMTIGSIEADTFTMNNEGMLLTYRKPSESSSAPAGK